MTDISWTCDCGEPLVRKMFGDDIQCCDCGQIIPGRSRRLMCELPACAFHLCNGCKTKAGSEGETNEGEVESNKRGHGQTPLSGARSKKGREATAPAGAIALTPG
eukprot:12430512-Karenia_brevis.AAC.1